MSSRARNHARRLVAALSDEDRRDLAEQPLVALEMLGYTVCLRPEREIEGTCSVAGSFDIGPPPTITVVQTRSRGRRNFTGLHELGHRLVAEDDELQDLFADEQDYGRKLEEDVCDAIAAELLLPDEIVDRFIGDRGPTARAVIDLFHDRSASREACCVRAVQRIAGVGHVMLVKDGVAQFTATTNTPFRVRRQTPQPNNPVIKRAAERGGARGEAPLLYASGALSDRFFVDAMTDGDYLFVVFVEGRPAWIDGLAVMTTARKDELGRIDVTETTSAFCPHCDLDFEAMGAPCPTCSGYFHKGKDSCGLCSCGTDASEAPTVPVVSKVCSECFLRRPIADFSNDNTTCDICRGI